MAAIAGLAVTLVGGAEIAASHDARYDSRVRITGYIDNQSFLGRVGSEPKACKRKRLVTVWKRNPGSMDGPVGTAKTNRQGIWAVPAPNASPGRYYATVRKRVLRKGGHHHVCKRARSKLFDLEWAPATPHVVSSVGPPRPGADLTLGGPGRIRAPGTAAPSLTTALGR